MSAHVRTPKRLRLLGYEATPDQGGGFEIWAGRARVGRVFSRAALETWQPPAAEILSPTRAKLRASGQMELNFDAIL